MTVLILGAYGMLGRAFANILESRAEPFVGLDREHLDVAERADIEAALRKHTPSLVLNCAAYTAVDDAERDEATATRINGDAARILAEGCATRGVPLVHYSTDYVFAGDASAPYRTDEPLAPLNAYGRSKAVGEEAIRAVGGDFLIVRTSWLYAPWATNFVRTIHKLSKDRPVLKVVDDQRGRPTSAEHLARVSLALADGKAHGTLHVTDGGECTWFEFAKEIVRLSGHACDVQPCSSAEFPRPAKRPAYSVLDLGPTEALVGPMRDWRQNLADTIERLEP